jgi:hypothetical protein
VSADSVRIVRIDEARREPIASETSWCVRFRVAPRWPSAAWRQAFEAQLQQPVPAGRRALYGFSLVCTGAAPEPDDAAPSRFGMRLRRALHRLRSRTEIQVICPAGAEHLRMARAQLVTLVRLTNQAVAEQAPAQRAAAGSSDTERRLANTSAGRD